MNEEERSKHYTTIIIVMGVLFIIVLGLSDPARFDDTPTPTQTIEYPTLPAPQCPPSECQLDWSNRGLAGAYFWNNIPSLEIWNDRGAQFGILFEEEAVLFQVGENNTVQIHLRPEFLETTGLKGLLNELVLEDNHTVTIHATDGTFIHVSNYNGRLYTTRRHLKGE